MRCRSNIRTSKRLLTSLYGLEHCREMELTDMVMERERSIDDIPGKPPIKVLEGSQHRRMSKWERFDRLQRSLRPLRKGKHPRKGIHYGPG